MFARTADLTPRPAVLGGGWRLNLIAPVIVGAGLYGPAEYSLAEADRAAWRAGEPMQRAVLWPVDGLRIAIDHTSCPTLALLSRHLAPGVGLEAHHWLALAEREAHLIDPDRLTPTEQALFVGWLAEHGFALASAGAGAD